MNTRILSCGFAVLFSVLLSAQASAFCGFYVSGSGKKLSNDATQVVLLREGKRTVLSMQNSYKGPPQDFAMVVPVPVVLQKENVKTLPSNIFKTIDAQSAPRLVEYWEQDPCAPQMDYLMDTSTKVPSSTSLKKSVRAAKKAVKIEAQFKRGEYEIVVLSTTDSGALDRWLKDNQYKIPKNAEPLLRPYVEEGMYFFVARVNANKVSFDKRGRAVLSPLRFHYDTSKFALPIRLGLMNATGKQDLIVNILAKDRYEVANYKNVTIPTNLGVHKSIKKDFASFYAALFDKTLEKNPGAVVTEYAWASSTCDPCPGPTISQQEFLSLGGDVARNQNMWNYTLTRLHARYDKKSLGEDLIFTAVDPIAGGREFLRDGKELEESSVKDSTNQFQGRYIIRHPWKGKVACQNPQRGIWGGPPRNKLAQPKPTPATDLATAKRGKVKLKSALTHSVPEIGIQKKGKKPYIRH